MTAKRLWHKLQFSEWDNGCAIARAGDRKFYFFKNKPISYEEYKCRLMHYFKDFDEDYD